MSRTGEPVYASQRHMRRSFQRWPWGAKRPNRPSPLFAAFEETAREPSQLRQLTISGPRVGWSGPLVTATESSYWRLISCRSSIAV